MIPRFAFVLVNSSYPLSCLISKYHLEKLFRVSAHTYYTALLTLQQPCLVSLHPYIANYDTSGYN